MRCSAKGCKKKAVYYVRENKLIEWYFRSFKKLLSPEFFVCDDHTAVEAFFTRPVMKKIKGKTKYDDYKQI
jgi:hypothetical protein